MEAVDIVEHPAVADRLAGLRDAATLPPAFRRLMEEIGIFLAYEATRDLKLRETTVATPVGGARVKRLSERPVAAPVLRAGLGLLPGFLAVVDDAVVAHLGVFRDPHTLEAVPYYANLPERLHDTRVFVLDPMLATGHSGAAVLDVLAAQGASAPVFVCVLAAPEGIAYLHARHPAVRVVTAGIDERLNERGYIVPGLGDAGDRMFGSASSLPMGYRTRGA